MEKPLNDGEDEEEITFTGWWYFQGELKAKIHNCRIIWDVDGSDEDMSTPLNFLSQSKISVNIDGEVYIADLDGDKLHWSDDQTWEREKIDEFDEAGFEVFNCPEELTGTELLLAHRRDQLDLANMSRISIHDNCHVHDFFQRIPQKLSMDQTQMCNMIFNKFDFDKDDHLKFWEYCHFYNLTNLDIPKCGQEIYELTCNYCDTEQHVGINKENFRKIYSLKPDQIWLDFKTHYWSTIKSKDMYSETLQREIYIFQEHCDIVNKTMVVYDKDRDGSLNYAELTHLIDDMHLKEFVWDEDVYAELRGDICAGNSVSSYNLLQLFYVKRWELICNYMQDVSMFTVFQKREYDKLLPENSKTVVLFFSRFDLDNDHFISFEELQSAIEAEFVGQALARKHFETILKKLSLPSNVPGLTRSQFLTVYEQRFPELFGQGDLYKSTMFEGQYEMNGVYVAEIWGRCIVWPSGKVMECDIDNEELVQPDTLGDKMKKAGFKLEQVRGAFDGSNLYWSNGDVWTLKTDLEGDYERKGRFVATIKGKRIIWPSGIKTQFRVDHLNDDTDTKLTIDYHGETLVGTCKDDNVIFWSDGDKWTKRFENEFAENHTHQELLVDLSKRAFLRTMTSIRSVDIADYVVPDSLLAEFVSGIDAKKNSDTMSDIGVLEYKAAMNHDRSRRQDWRCIDTKLCGEAFVSTEERNLLNEVQEDIFERQFPLSRKARYMAWAIIIVWILFCDSICVILGIQFDLAQQNKVDDIVSAARDEAILTCPNGKTFSYQTRWEFNYQTGQVELLSATPEPDDTYGQVGDASKWLLSVLISLLTSWCCITPAIHLVISIFDISKNRNYVKDINAFDFLKEQWTGTLDFVPKFELDMLLLRPILILDVMRIWEEAMEYMKNPKKRAEVERARRQSAGGINQTSMTRDLTQITTLIDSRLNRGETFCCCHICDLCSAQSFETS